MKRFDRRANLLWVVAYVAAMVYLGVTMFNLRAETLHSMGTPEAQADWDVYGKAVRGKSPDLGPDRRKPPKSPEPPGLVLMRDYFGVMFTTALVFGTALFLMLVWVVKGVLWQPGRPDSGGEAG